MIDHHYCVSETGATYLRARGLPSVDFFRYSTTLPSLPDSPKTRKVVYVGRFDADKNIGETLRLFALFKRHGYSVRMIGGGTGEPMVRAALPSEEILVGVSRERIFQELGEASFLCHNSYVEGLPIIHTEAIYFRLGVICNYVDKSIHEVLGENALLWNNEEDLLRRMERFVFTPVPGPARINNPALNAAFLARLAATARNSSPRARLQPPSLLDRLGNPVLAAFVRRFRRWRWLRHTPLHLVK